MLSFIFSPLGRYIGMALVVVFVVGAIYVKGRHDGADAIRAAVAARAVQAGKDLRDAENEARRLPDDALFDRLRGGR